jgi:hypothetical protein
MSRRLSPFRVLFETRWRDLLPTLVKWDKRFATDQQSTGIKLTEEVSVKSEIFNVEKSDD